MASIRLENLHQTYGNVQVLQRVNLHIHEGEFFSLLGPSGSGKTTLLRLLAGFEPPAQGQIFIGEHEVTGLPPEKREVGMVFQNYALFPHLSVGGNVAYGLRAKGVHHVELQQRVHEALELVDLKGFEDRDVHTLSGGQQQRVALARAIAPHPRVLLMDEPLSNLDVRLRIQTRAQIRDLQRRLGTTTVYVTHDQSEAFSLSDRIAVLLQGEIIQIGTPREVYRLPVNQDLAEFLGEMNWISGTLCDLREGYALVNILDRVIKFPVPGSIDLPPAGQQVRVGIRPEAFGPEHLFQEKLAGFVREVQYEGEQWRIVVECQGARLTLVWPSPCLVNPPPAGQEMGFSLDNHSLMVLPETPGKKE